MVIRPDPPEVSARLGALLRAAMRDRERTQLQLADLLGVPQPAISRRLAGLTPWSVDELVRVAAWLELDPAQLLDAAA